MEAKMDIATDAEWGDSETSEGSKGIMEHTGGLWVRKNRKVDQIEIWFDGVFYCAWKDADVIEVRLVAMLRAAVEIGEKKAKADIRAAIGCR